MLGNTALASVNFDWRVRDDFSFRLGVTPDFAFLAYAFFHGEDTEREPEPLDTMFFVLMANHLVGTGRHRLELGFGPLLGTSADPFYDFIPRVAVTGTLGYRYLPGLGGWGLRAGLAPIYDGSRWLLRPGVSLVFGVPEAE